MRRTFASRSTCWRSRSRSRRFCISSINGSSRNFPRSTLQTRASDVTGAGPRCAPVCFGDVYAFAAPRRASERAPDRWMRRDATVDRADPVVTPCRRGSIGRAARPASHVQRVLDGVQLHCRFGIWNGRARQREQGSAGAVDGAAHAAVGQRRGARPSRPDTPDDRRSPRSCGGSAARST